MTIGILETKHADPAANVSNLSPNNITISGFNLASFRKTYH